MPDGTGASWLSERSRNGAADEIPLPEGPGRLWLCGKHYIGPDVEGARRRLGADRVVCLCERHELEDRYPAYVAWLASHADEEAVWFPIHDLHAPTVDRVLPLLERVQAWVRAGDGVLMHCGAGIGRAGTLATALLIRMGAEPAAAEATVASARPMAGPEAGAQRDLLAAITVDRSGG